MGKEVIPIERIARAILVIRREKVMLDSDLAALYGVTTENLNKAVKRNAKRFPTDFMFQLDAEEVANLKFQFGISSWGGRRRLPYAFTEQGVAMLSSVLNSERIRGAHAPRVLAMAASPSRTFSSARIFYIPHAFRRSRFSARRRKEHARRVCSPA